MDANRLSFNNYLGALPRVLFGAIFMTVGAGIFFGMPFISSHASPFGLMFVLAGTVVVFMYTIRSVSTDKTTATLTYSYWSILSRGSLSLPFASISSIRFTKIYIRRKKGGRWEAHTVFKQQDGNELDVPQAIGNQDDAKKIADVIGVPFTYDKPPSLVDVFGLAGSAISAGMHKYQQEMEKQPKE